MGMRWNSGLRLPKPGPMRNTLISWQVRFKYKFIRNNPFIVMAVCTNGICADAFLLQLLKFDVNGTIAHFTHADEVSFDMTMFEQ